jgi:hypothetical protein
MRLPKHLERLRERRAPAAASRRLGQLGDGAFMPVSNTSAVERSLHICRHAQIGAIAPDAWR